MSFQLCHSINQSVTSIPAVRPAPRTAAPEVSGAVSAEGSADIAESDPAGLGRAEFHVGDLVGRHQDPAALADREREDGVCPAAQGGGKIPLYFLRRSVGLHDQLTRNRMNSD